MREILFRGRCNGGPWLYGSLLVYSDGYCEICVPDGDDALEKFRVDPDTVGQFTGRYDHNGKKVFEHDNLQLYIVWASGMRQASVKAVVQWCENDQCYVLTTKDGTLCDDFGNLGRPEYYEVIGNIHDNPDLLGGADNA